MLSPFEVRKRKERADKMRMGKNDFFSLKLFPAVFLYSYPPVNDAISQFSHRMCMKLNRVNYLFFKEKMPYVEFLGFQGLFFTLLLLNKMINK